jgi:protein SERAC1
MNYLKHLFTSKTSSDRASEQLVGLQEIAGFQDANREGDVIFVHGLGGNARSTWHPKEQEDDDDFWLYWLSQDYQNIGILSFGYEAKPSGWKGSAMPLFDQAGNLLEWMESKGIGQKPIVFVTHSLGGLLVKKMLNTAQTRKRQNIIEQTKGIVFLSTPHTGSDLADFISKISTIARTTISVDELKAHASQLRELNDWYRENVTDFKVATKVYFETEPIYGIKVVDESSANPGIKGVMPIAIPETHITIAKPDSRDSLVYLGTKRFIQECFCPVNERANPQYSDPNISEKLADRDININGDGNSTQIGNNNRSSIQISNKDKDI